MRSRRDPSTDDEETTDSEDEESSRNAKKRTRSLRHGGAKRARVGTYGSSPSYEIISNCATFLLLSIDYKDASSEDSADSSDYEPEGHHKRKFYKPEGKSRRRKNDESDEESRAPSPPRYTSSGRLIQKTNK